MKKADKSIIYQDLLGIAPLINAAGSLTTLGGSLIDPRVMAAMTTASRHFVDVHELNRAAGERIARLLGVEAAHPCAGSSAGITLMAAACMTGTDPDKIRQLPDTSGLCNRFVVHRSHRNRFDHAVRVAGGAFVEIETRVDDLERALAAGAAGVYYAFAWYNPGDSLPLAQAARIAHQAGVPVIVDAAAQVPPPENLAYFVHQGADLAVFSGGKILQGPQGSGCIVGRREMVAACVLNASPHVECIGRGLKVSKEDVVGLVKAVELYLQQDHGAIMAGWERQVDYLIDALTSRGLHPERRLPAGIGNLIPYVALSWPPASSPLTPAQVADRLRRGRPPVAVRLGTDQPELWLHVHTLQPGEEAIVTRRLLAVLSESV